MEKEYEDLKKFLDDNSIIYTVTMHEKVFTSEEAARIRGVPLSSGVKAMVVTSERGFFLVLVPGDRKIDFDKLKPLIGRAKLASPEDVIRITNCEVGSVHPFGNLFGLSVLMDRRILDNSTVNFNVGLHEVSINMDPKDIVSLVKPEIGDYSVEK